MTAIKTVSLAMTGASGADYGLRLLEQLLAKQVNVRLMLSKPAKIVISMECSLKLPARTEEMAVFLCQHFSVNSNQLQVYGEKHWFAPPASGSGVSDAMVICPCTTGTLAAVATGQSRSLLERAADVSLKERKRLILVIRETPFSEIHLENMLRLTRMGAVMMPANPGFYQQPKMISDLVDFMVARVLDQLGIPQTLLPPWGEKSSHSS